MKTSIVGLALLLGAQSASFALAQGAPPPAMRTGVSVGCLIHIRSSHIYHSTSCAWTCSSPNMRRVVSMTLYGPLPYAAVARSAAGSSTDPSAVTAVNGGAQ